LTETGQNSRGCQLAAADGVTKAHWEMQLKNLKMPLLGEIWSVGAQAEFLALAHDLSHQPNVCNICEANGFVPLISGSDHW